MYIKRLRVKGLDKPDAEVNFSDGLNVIAGASDTGKSFIMECISFILGSGNVPRDIEQADGYDSVELTLVANRKTILLERELKSNAKIVVLEGDETPRRVLSPTHKKGNNDNISNFLLKEIDLDNKELLIGKKKGTKRGFSIRYLERVILVDEARMISKDSPLGIGNYQEKTLEASMLELLMTGIDASKVESIEKNKISAAKISIQIETLSEIVKEKKSELPETSPSIDEIDDTLEKLEKSIRSIEIESLTDDGEIQEKSNERRKISELVSQKSDALQEIVTYFDRFNLLREKYQSDKERVDSISEASEFLAEYESQVCPTCGADIDIENDSEIDTELILLSSRAEITKLDILISDLTNSINKLEVDQALIESEINDLKTKDEDISNDLTAAFAPRNEQRISNLKDLFKRQNELKGYKECKEAIKILHEKIGLLTEKLGGLKIDADDIDFSITHDSLIEKIENILTQWGFPSCQPIIYDPKTRDIVIGGKPRSHFGKGYRAISFTAFIVGLMHHLMEKERHIGFVVIDSPLTTYRAPDGSKGSEINKDMIYALYKNLSQTDDKGQIIILENQEPADDLHDKMTYIHFSRNTKIGRYGFFPKV